MAAAPARAAAGTSRVALLAGLAGPLIVVLSLAVRYHLGFDAPWYLLELAGLGYISPTAVALTLAGGAAGAQLAAVAAGRYAPYPERGRRPGARGRSASSSAGSRGSSGRGGGRPRSAGGPSGSYRPQVLHDGARGDPALAARHAHERVRRGRTHDHVRRLPGDRLEPDGVVAGPAGGPYEVVAGGHALERPVEAAGEVEGPRLGALQRAQRGTDEQLERDQRRDRVSRQAEDEGLAPHGEGHRLPRAHGDPPEHLLGAEPGERPPDEILDAHRHAARGHDDVGLERRRELRECLLLVVGDGLEPDHLGACRPAEHRQQRRVRLVDLARRQRLSRPAQLAAGRDDGDARLRCARRAWRHPRQPPRRSAPRRAACRRQRRRRRRAHRLRGLARCLLGQRSRPRFLLRSSRTSSIGTTVSAPSGTTAPVEIATASPARGPAAAGAPADDLPAEPQRARRVGRTHRVAVHRRAGKRGQVDGRPDVVRGDAARRVLDRHLLRSGRRAPGRG